MLVLGDIGFYIFHTVLIGFNMCGWIWKRTRLWHLITMGLTTFSWFAMGAFYGWGYCLCTDWHFQIREQLGKHDTVTTYVQLMSETFLGLPMSQRTSDILAGSVYLLIVLATVIVWTQDLRKRKAFD